MCPAELEGVPADISSQMSQLAGAPLAGAGGRLGRLLCARTAGSD